MVQTLTLLTELTASLLKPLKVVALLVDTTVCKGVLVEAEAEAVITKPLDTHQTKQLHPWELQPTETQVAVTIRGAVVVVARVAQVQVAQRELAQVELEFKTQF
jgi:hypothetical protein